VTPSPAPSPEGPPGAPPRAFTLRAAQRGDVPAIAALARQFAQLMHELGDSTSLQLDAAALERDGFGPDPAFGGLLAEREGRVVGYLLHHPGYDTDAARRLLFVVDLFVTPAARGLGIGIGAALIAAARDIAARAGAAQLVWTVDSRNAGALRFYESLGAQRVEGLVLMCLDA
jgi:GNAT superfamily N-acetyltransferase